MMSFDWNQMRGFLATAEAGSLSAAARRLGLTQPTLSRQVAALEAELGVTLFERVGKTLVLTQTGTALLHHARAMGEAAERLSLLATGRSEAVEGLVSISASEAIAAMVLPPIVRRIRQEAPGLSIEIVSTNALSDIRRREADIAIRHVRPTEPELFGRMIREASACFYASDAFVAKHGLPVTAEEAQGLPFIGFDRSSRYADQLRDIGIETGEKSFPVLSDSSLACWEMMREGLGICVMMDDIARTTPGIVQVLTAVPPVTFPLWLVTHRELHTSRKIRLVFDMLAEGLA